MKMKKRPIAVDCVEVLSHGEQVAAVDTRVGWFIVYYIPRRERLAYNCTDYTLDMFPYKTGPFQTLEDAKRHFMKEYGIS